MNFLPRANSQAGTSNDAAPASGSEYQVFLSFRGPDTRHGFTDFLYNDLSDVGVRVFRDDDELRIGELISDNLLSAINNSIIYIPIFSQTYASSKWCLWELAHIVDNVSKSEDEKCIFPIFLDVGPDDVKLKTQIYSNALLEHERKFPNEVEAWRAALAAVGKIKGLNVTSSQAAIVKLVVEEVLKKLKIKQKSVTEYLVGFDDRIKELTKFLDVNHDDVRLIGIYGMGGIGKTTIAKVVFNKLCSHFGKCCSFLDDVRERSNKEGIVSLQKQLLVDIGCSGTVGDINNSEEGMRRIRETFKNKKVLVVLDDVDKKELIKNLIGNSKLYRGSRIIITTRNTNVLEVEGFKGETQQYEMLKMDAGPALQLFCRHAFSGDFPSDDYRWLSKRIVSTTGGLPLAIQVIGSLLKGKHQEIWEETLEKLRNVPAKEILEKLRISYDDLEEHQKQIFLDIACFFVNENKTNTIYMWTDCQFYPKGGIQVLSDRCLIKILDDDKFWMHDQLIALGRQIVREDSPNDPEKHSRLWIAKEALQIIGTKSLDFKDDSKAWDLIKVNYMF
ncbi:disease resistance protein RUN1-like [Eucalyptus grandis]|uniref:disease resistance protein RUN1-like n=1 Tax=Eucalyptus grandis TaxID=71139 RepID=UPI00192EABFD|nr:disease resistance protein RUN1-like [Eucalyptus grandis]